MTAAAISWLPFLDELADSADAIALAHFRAPGLSSELKPDESPVTLADRGIESAIRLAVRRRHPELGVLGEEEGETGTHQSRLILDPIDGTRNYLRGIPVFATLLAVEEDGEVVAGMVSAPAMGLRWHAARGAGAWCGSRRLMVSAVAPLAGATLFHSSIGGRAEGNPLPALHRLAAAVARTRGFGDFYQHLLVAEGAGEIAVDPTMRPWDIAALLVIVEEAGGRCTTLAGERTIYGGSLISTNGLVHDEVIEILSHARPDRSR
ncbi:MAG TPA: inositol monophosphatase family protein [Gemmatimonadales bacterium]|nr:inositol monophosphatase family protein [Gemmatimonadales bacterium]